MIKQKKSALTLKILTLSAMLSALSIVMGKFLAINAGEVLRFSFENLPILFSAYAFGPLVAIAVGVVADLVGCLMVGYSINPLVTLGAALIGGGSGVIFYIGRRLRLSPTLNLVLGVFIGHILGSVLVKTVGLAAFYQMPFGVLMLWRLLNYAIIGALEAVILYFLFKNSYLNGLVLSFGVKDGKGGERKDCDKSEYIKTKEFDKGDEDNDL
ncbi:MAG: folate family ECF transporter S component [Clostridia bacterium]|nr:folate family ECF transporter S component [Clostridia bacterium]